MVVRTAPSLADADWLAWPQTQAVFAALSQDGHEARAVGGAVRNTLLGLPVKEIDLATTAAPEVAMGLAKRAGLKAVPTGIDHGTVTIIAEHQPFETTTLRTDVETYGRKAKVAFTDDWTQDARRRDFTINALYAGADGTLFDPLGGLADIEQRRVRFIGDARERIREDFLRILRFFRFNAVYAAPPYDADGLAACVSEREGLSHLSPERVHTELLRLLAAGGAAPSLWAMFDYGLLVDVLGGVPYLPRCERLIALEAALGREPDALLRLAALTVAVAEDAGWLRDRFRLSNAEHARLVRAADYAVLIHRLRPNGAIDEHEAKAALYRLGRDAFADQVLIAWAESAAPDDAAWRDLYGLPERWTAPEFPLRGQDLMDLGVAMGPHVGELLHRLEADWIAGDFRLDRDGLLAAARKLIRQQSGRG